MKNNKPSRVENALAIKNCLEYLAKEARDYGNPEIARMIDLATLAAEDAARAGQRTSLH